MRLWALLAVAAAGGLVLGAVVRSAPDPDAVPTTDEVAQRMMSPFCDGLTVEECPSGQSAELRREISAMVEQGATNAEIDEWIVQNYGEVGLARPAGAVAWLAPGLLVVAGAAVVLLVLRRRPGSGDGDAPALSPEEQREVERDFDSFQRGSE